MSYHEEMRNLEAQLDVAEATLASTKNEIQRAKDAKNKRRFEALRENPDLLAAHIAVKIRREGKSISAHDEEFVKGQHKVGWNQRQWGEVNAGSLTPIDLSGLGDDWMVAQCATTGCIAGHAGIAVGYQMLVSQSVLDYLRASHSEWDVEKEKYIEPEADADLIVTSDSFLLPDKSVQEIPEVAAELLALDDDQRIYLFAGDRTYEQVLAVLDMIAQGNYNWHAAWQNESDDYVVFTSLEERHRYEQRAIEEYSRKQREEIERRNAALEPLADWERELLAASSETIQGQSSDNGEDDEAPF